MGRSAMGVWRSAAEPQPKCLVGAGLVPALSVGVADLRYPLPAFSLLGKKRYLECVKKCVLRSGEWR
jgi:hypothetical protein